MKRFTFILAAVLITASLAFSQGVQVTLLHTSDSHSHLTESGVKNTSGFPTQGGISRFTGMVGYLKPLNQIRYSSIAEIIQSEISCSTVISAFPNCRFCRVQDATQWLSATMNLTWALTHY